MKFRLLLLLLIFISCAKKQPTISTPPNWAKDAIWYQIFPERFRNGNTNNDHTIKNIEGSWPNNYDENWKITPWTSNWYENKNEYAPIDFYNLDIQSRRYGGDIKGILDKLDYIEDLGINAIYINPINDAPSLHKYDARNYRHIDVNLGNDPLVDAEIMQLEDPTNPETWEWTSADELFLSLITELHKRNIKIIMDYSWNHTGVKFWAWEDILKNGENSKYANWYEIESFDDPTTSDNEFKYIGWAGVPDLPELRKVDVKNRVHGKPYSGNILPEVKQHIFNVSKRWLDPNGDGNTEDGVDGYRLDVADQIGMDFWREYRTFVKNINPEAILIGEIWWEDWPDILMDPRPYVKGDIFDNVMFYQAYKPSRDFFAKTNGYGGAEKLVKEYALAVKDLPKTTIESMMMMSASHDSPKLISSFLNKGKYKYNVKPIDNANFLSGKPDEETIARVKLFLAYQFTMPGAPQIWAGDEMGMWGADDPDTRKPLWWNDLTFENETEDPYKKEKASYEVSFNKELHAYYKHLIKIRKEYPILRTGDLVFTEAKGDLLIYERNNTEQKIKIIINNGLENITIPKDIKGTSFVITGTEIPVEENKDNFLNIGPLSAVVIFQD